MASGSRLTLALTLLLALIACRFQAEGTASAPPTIGQDAAPDESCAGETGDAPQAPSPASAAPSAPLATDWCIEGLTALEEDVCYVLPPLREAQPRRLLVYLHGLLPPVRGIASKRSFETIVLDACTRAGVAALIPRGQLGIGPSFARDSWAWPTHADDIARLTPAIVARWAAAKQKLEAIAGAPFERTYLAGVSNGAYFLTAIALRGDVPTADFPIDGFGAMSGGGATDRLAARAARPVYVGYGLYDEVSIQNARPLVSGLRAAGWPVAVAEHPLAHGSNEVYVDEALAFWGTQAAEP